MADTPRSVSVHSDSIPDDVATTSDGRHGVKALCRRAGRVLLIEEVRADRSTFWTLPGGGVSPGESPTVGLQRELAEELNCVISCGDPVGTCTYDHTCLGDITTVYTVFDCTLESEPSANREEGVRRHAWVEPTARPDGLLDPFAALLDTLVDDGGG